MESAYCVCRINEAEQRIGAGLIEEVVQVAEGELKLVDTMLESKAYVHTYHGYRGCQHADE